MAFVVLFRVSETKLLSCVLRFLPTLAMTHYTKTDTDNDEEDSATKCTPRFARTSLDKLFCLCFHFNEESSVHHSPFSYPNVMFLLTLVIFSCLYMKFLYCVSKYLRHMYWLKHFLPHILSFIAWSDSGIWYFVRMKSHSSLARNLFRLFCQQFHFKLSAQQ